MVHRIPRVGEHNSVYRGVIPRCSISLGEGADRCVVCTVSMPTIYAKKPFFLPDDITVHPVPLNSNNPLLVTMCTWVPGTYHIDVESMNLGFKSKLMRSLFVRIRYAAESYVESYVESSVKLGCKRRFEYVKVVPLSRYSIGLRALFRNA